MTTIRIQNKQKHQTSFSELLHRLQLISGFNPTTTSLHPLSDIVEHVVSLQDVDLTLHTLKILAEYTEDLRERYETLAHT